MSDLISKSKLIDFLRTENQRCITSTGRELTMNIIYTFIELQPEAYDLNKVISELEDAVQYVKINGKPTSVEAIHPAQAIKIVKQGGIISPIHEKETDIYNEPEEHDL